MAKRFTDSEKWKRPWFRKLEPVAKLAWTYILDNCDHAGIWPADFDLMSFQIGGFEITEKWLLKTFGDKVKHIDRDKYFIPSFIEFQYGELNPNNKAHASVLSILEKVGACKPLESPFQGAKDKDKEKDKDTELDKDTEKDQEKDKARARVKRAKPANDADPDNAANVFIATYCEAFKARYETNPPITGKDAGIAKRLVKDLGVIRACELVETFLAMNDSFFLTRRHDLFTFESNLKNVAVKHDTGAGITRNQAQKAEIHDANVQAMKDYMAGKVSL